MTVGEVEHNARNSGEMLVMWPTLFYGLMNQSLIVYDINCLFHSQLNVHETEL